MVRVRFIQSCFGSTQNETEVVSINIDGVLID